MAEASESVTRVIERLSRLPGIGRKSAERLAYHLLRVPISEAFELADAIRQVRENLRYCKSCFNLSEADICTICSDPTRDRSLLCIVEQPRDLMAIEQAGSYRGLYHVLLGRLSPLDNIGPDQLTIDALVDRVAATAQSDSPIAEIIMGTNPTVEGDGTALFLSNALAEFEVKITKLARGITTGSNLEYTNKEILADAMSSRQPL